MSEKPKKVIKKKKTVPNVVKPKKTVAKKKIVVEPETKQGAKKKKKLKEVPQPTLLLHVIALVIIMLGGYGIISNIIHEIAVSQKVVIDYSSYDMAVLKSTLHEMNGNLYRLNIAKGSQYLTPEEFQALKSDFNEGIEIINQLSYITEIGQRKLTQEQLYRIYQENTKLQYVPLLHIYSIMEKLDPDYAVTREAFRRNVVSLMWSNGMISSDFYGNFRYTSFDDSKIIGTVSLDQTTDIPMMTTQLTTNYVQITDALLKMVIQKGGLYYE